MREPSLRTSRLAIAGGLIAAIVVGGIGFVLGRSTAPEPPAPLATPAPIPTATPKPVALPVPRPMDRGDIIALAATAADAMAAGKEPPQALDDAVGRRVAIVIPFGCDGPAPENSSAPLRWRYDADKGALRLHVAPATWRAGDWWRQGNAPDMQAIEGFWVTHPWTSSDRCPVGGSAASPGFESVTLPGQTLAIAQFFPAGGTRLSLHDGDPFEAVVRLARGDFRAKAGFRLRLTGKIDRVPGGGPARCIQPAGIEQRPICVIAMSFDELAIENTATGDTLATWPVGGSRSTPPESSANP